MHVASGKIYLSGMAETNHDFSRDLETIHRIPIVSMILDVICQTTGMGFAAVARVTETKWLACSVRDDIGFGLKAGEELPLQTTLCHEVKNCGVPIVIENVAHDPQYSQHHTPKLYGLQSYIAYPITLKNGNFFGTLCAIDPRPAELKQSKITNMFSLFADLLSFHIESVEMMDRNQKQLNDTSRELNYAQEENLQYRHISAHTLREPLRKLLFYSDLLVTRMPAEVPVSYNDMVLKIRRFAGDLDRKVRAVADMANVFENPEEASVVNLETVVNAAADEIRNKTEKPLALTLEQLPEVHGIPGLLGLVFYHLFQNAIQFSKPGTTPSVTVTSRTVNSNEVSIEVTDQGIGIEEYRLENIFNFFEHSDPANLNEGLGTGLSIARRIVHLHKGRISAFCKNGVGTVFTIVLPLQDGLEFPDERD